MTKEIFISYSSTDSNDSKWAEWIAGTLEKNGFSVFISAWDLHPGDDFITKANEAIQGASVFMPILSDSYTKSVYCTAELGMAFGEKVSNKPKIFPVRVSNTTPSGMLANIQYLDLYNSVSEKEAEQQLLNVLKKYEISKYSPNNSTITRSYEIEYPRIVIDNNLPRRNEYFSGRDKDFVSIDLLFKEKDNTPVNICQTVTGLGGVGKTQLAIEYAYRYGKNYKNCIWFIISESSTTVYNYFIDFANHFNITLPPDFKPEDLQWAIKSWLHDHNNWFLIFDNLENYADIEPYLPNSNNGHFIITTRKDNIGVGAKLGLSVFSKDEALKFLKKRLVDYGIEDLKFPDFDEKVPILAERLGYLPLALEQAATYIVKTKCSISTYLEYIKESDLGVFDDEYANPEHYEAIVNTTWKISMDLLPQESQWLFNLCAYMAPDRIPIVLFERNRDILPEPLKSKLGKVGTRTRIVSSLYEYSLASGNNEYINIHRLIQELIRCVLIDSLEWLDICLKIFLSDVPHEFDDWESKEWFDRIAKHAYSVANNAYSAFENQSTKMNNISELYFRLGCGFHELEQYYKALECYHKTLTINERVLGEEHPNTIKIYNNMAKTCQNIGNYSQALKWFQKSLEIGLKATDENDPSFVNTYNNIGSIYSNQANYSEALVYYQKAMAISHKILGFEHPSTAMIYNYIAYMYSHLGNYRNALEWYQKTLTIYEKIFGVHHPFIVTAYNNIAIVYQNQGKNDVALEYYRKASVISENVLDKEDILSIRIRAKINTLEGVQNNTSNNIILDTTEMPSLLVDLYANIYKKLPDSKINKFCEWYASLPSDVKLSNDSEFRTFLTNLQSFINKIKIMSAFSPDDINSPELCQYTKLKTLKFLVKAKTEDDKIQIQKFRLSNVAYLNDPSEGQVFIDLLNKCSQEPIFTEIFGVSSAKNELSLAELHLNDVYIGSFSTAKNILPMWTLYGDNSNGCCMVFDDSFFVTSRNKNDLSELNEFGQDIKLYKVRYYNTKELCQTNDEDKILHSLQAIATSIEQWYSIVKLNSELLKWIISRLDEIRFLFKCKDYSYEDEIRLILRDDKYNQPFVDRTTEEPKLFINVNNPVVFKEVILGAKVENPSALAQFLLFAGVKKVTLSGITYR